MDLVLLFKRLCVLTAQNTTEAVWQWAEELQSMYIPGGIVNKTCTFSVESQEDEEGVPCRLEVRGEALPPPPSREHVFI